MPRYSTISFAAEGIAQRESVDGAGGLDRAYTPCCISSVWSSALVMKHNCDGGVDHSPNIVAKRRRSSIRPIGPDQDSGLSTFFRTSLTPFA